MEAILAKLKDALVVAGMAAIATFISVLFQTLGLPSPVAPDINIVGDDPLVIAEMGRAVAQTTLRTAIPIPIIIMLIQFAFSFFGGTGSKK